MNLIFQIVVPAHGVLPGPEASTMISRGHAPLGRDRASVLPWQSTTKGVDGHERSAATLPHFRLAEAGAMSFTDPPGMQSSDYNIFTVGAIGGWTAPAFPAGKLH